MRTIVVFLAGLFLFNLLAVLALTRCAAGQASATLTLRADVVAVWEAVRDWGREGGGEVRSADDGGGGGECRLVWEGAELWVGVQPWGEGRVLVLIQSRDEGPLATALEELRGRLAPLDPDPDLYRPPGQGRW